jgi:hypothetical protein
LPPVLKTANIFVLVFVPILGLSAGPAFSSRIRFAGLKAHAGEP